MAFAATEKKIKEVIVKSAKHSNYDVTYIRGIDSCMKGSSTIYMFFIPSQLYSLCASSFAVNSTNSDSNLSVCTNIQSCLD